MPVGTNGPPAMVRYSSFQSSRAKGAANINIKTGFELQGSKLADFNYNFSTRREDQCICAGKRLHVSKDDKLWFRHPLIVFRRVPISKIPYLSSSPIFPYKQIVFSLTVSITASSAMPFISAIA